MIQKAITNLILGAIRSEFERKHKAIEYAKIGMQKEKDRINSIISRSENLETYDFDKLYICLYLLNNWKNYSFRNAFNPILKSYGKDDDKCFFFGELNHVNIQIDTFVKLTGLKKHIVISRLRDLLEIGVITRYKLNSSYQYKLPEKQTKKRDV